MIFIGVDPGLDGALAAVTPDGAAVWDTPTVRLAKGRRDYLVPEMAALLLPHAGGGVVAIERVGARPGQGVTSMFTFGKGFGIWLGLLAALGVPYDLVTPQKWQKALGVAGDKGSHRLRASQLFPSLAHELRLASHDGRADALLLAEFMRRQYAGRG